MLCIQAEGHSSTEPLWEVLRGVGVHAETEVTVFLMLSDASATKKSGHTLGLGGSSALTGVPVACCGVLSHRNGGVSAEESV